MSISEYEKIRAETVGISEVFGKKENQPSTESASTTMLQEFQKEQQKFNRDVMQTLKSMQLSMMTEIKRMKEKQDEMISEISKIRGNQGSIEGKVDKLNEDSMKIQQDKLEIKKNPHDELKSTQNEIKSSTIPIDQAVCDNLMSESPKLQSESAGASDILGNKENGTSAESDGKAMLQQTQKVKEIPKNDQKLQSDTGISANPRKRDATTAELATNDKKNRKKQTEKPGTITITIQENTLFPIKNNFTFVMKPTSKISAIQSRIKYRTGNPVGSIHLFFGDKMLEYWQTLEKSGLVDGSVLRYFIHP